MKAERELKKSKPNNYSVLPHRKGGKKSNYFWAVTLQPQASNGLFYSGSWSHPGMHKTSLKTCNALLPDTNVPMVISCMTKNSYPTNGLNYLLCSY